VVLATGFANMANVLPLLNYFDPRALADQTTIENVPPLRYEHSPLATSPLGRLWGTEDGMFIGGGGNGPKGYTPPGPPYSPPLKLGRYPPATLMPPRPPQLQKPVLDPRRNIAKTSQFEVGEQRPGDFPLKDGGSMSNPQRWPQIEVQASPVPAGMDPRRGIQQGTDPGFGSYQPSAADFGEKQAQQPQQSPFTSDAGLMGLLAAGLGILANNTGHYGQAGPAIGKGGMMGLETFLGQRQLEERQHMARQELEQRNKQIEQTGAYQQAMIGQGDRRLGMEESEYKQKEAQALATRNLALQLAGTDPEQQRIAVANPDKYLDFKVAQLKPDYKQREIKEGTRAYDEYSIDGGKTWHKVPGGGMYDLKAAKGGTDISLKVGEKQGEAFTKPIAEQVDASFTKAMSAVESQKTLEGFRQRLNDPKLISGAGANVRLAVEQVAQLFGGDGSDLAATRDVIQGLAELTINSRGMLKGQGQVTEYEQKTLEKARSGDISLTVPELKALVNVFTRMNKAQYDAHGSTMRRLAKIKGGEQALEFYQPDPFPGAEQAPSGGKPWEREDIK
jgi:hypothetical protein